MNKYMYIYIYIQVYSYLYVYKFYLQFALIYTHEVFNNEKEKKKSEYKK